MRSVSVLIVAFSFFGNLMVGEADQVNFYVYTRKNPTKGHRMETDVESVIRNIYSPLKATTISIHGESGSSESAENLEIISAKLHQDDCNVIVAEWSLPTSIQNYNAEVTAIGVAIGDLLILLNQHFDVPYQRMHLVGFSLGAHLASVAARTVRSKTSNRIERLTALDPSIGMDNEVSLSKRDAQYVEVIHTNANGLGGDHRPCGHADYYPNGGRVQPGCGADDAACSHRRSYELVKEMWSERNEFIATRCSSANELSLQKCWWVNARMGFEASRPEGIFFLETNRVYPYAKGSYAHTYL